MILDKPSRILLTLVVIFSSLQLVLAQSPQEQISQLEKKRFAAMVDADEKTLQSVLSGQLSYTHSDGKVDDKAGYIASVMNGTMDYQEIVVLEEKVTLVHQTAVVSGKATVKAVRNGQPVNLLLRYTDVYVREKGKWQMLAWQSLKL